MSRTIAGPAVLLICVLGTLVLAGCADNQPGDVNNGPGYTNNVSDLLVKLPALDGDPCRGAQVATLFPNCGRYVTEVANTLALLRDDLPDQGASVTALQNAVNAFQRLGCDTVNGTATAKQLSDCPGALHAIGTELDLLGQALAAVSRPTSG
jgi:hypothetical protein